ncbi:MAG: right-handed parallel beta-helix repeat-containing protein, partial [Planctomycetota bacterium]
MVQKPAVSVLFFLGCAGASAQVSVPPAAHLQKLIDEGAPFVRVTESLEVAQSIRARSNLTIYCTPGVELRMKSGTFNGTNAKDAANSLLQIVDAENVEVQNCTLVMLKAEFVQPSEFRHAVRVTGSKNVRLVNVTAKDAGGDGFYLGVDDNVQPGQPRRGVENVTLDRCKATNSSRQGLTILSCKGCYVYDSEFSGSVGASPQSGVDIEAG